MAEVDANDHTENKQGVVRFLCNTTLILLLSMLTGYALLRLALYSEEHRFVDMRQFQPYGYWEGSEKQRGRWGLDKVYSSWQGKYIAQRPFRLTLRLDRQLHEGDWFASRASIPFTGESACISFFADTYLNATAARYYPDITVTVTANSEAKSWPIHALGDDVFVELEDIRPVDGKIDMEFRVESEQSREKGSFSGSIVYFNYLGIRKCK